MVNFRFFALIFIFILGSFGSALAKRKSVSWK